MGTRAHLGGAADGGARRHHREHRPPLHPARPRHLAGEPALGGHRVRPRLRQPAAARRAPRRPLRPPQGLHDRPGHLRRGFAARWPCQQRGHPARRSGPPGPRRRARLSRGSGADRHDVPGRSGPQPCLRGVRRDVRCRRGRRPAARRLADRHQPRAVRYRHRRLAAHPADQHADRHHRGPARPAPPQRVRVPPGRARPARRCHRYLRPARPRLRHQPRRHRRLDRHLDDRQPGRRCGPARCVPVRREPGRAPAAADPGLRQPHPCGELRGDVLRTGRDVRDVLLPQPLHPERDGLQLDRGRRRVPAVLHRSGPGGRHLVEPHQPDGPADPRGRRHPDGSDRAVRVLADPQRHHRCRSRTSPRTTGPTCCRSSW